MSAATPLTRAAARRLFRAHMAQSFADYPQISNPECAWTPLREWGGLPNVKWCEETLCSVIAEPANTWSNLAYLLVAGGLWWFTRKDESRTLRFWAPVAFWVGITSLVYHASVAFVTQVFDFWGMYFFFGLILLLNLLRMGKLKADALFKTLYAAIFGLTAFTVVVAKLQLPVQGIVMVMIVLTLITEVLATRASAGKVDHRFFGVSLAFIAVAAGFSASDASGLRCDPHDHVFQGHAIWHVLGSISIAFAHLHYRQFKSLFR
jgi:hypothetical protein